MHRLLHPSQLRDQRLRFPIAAIALFLTIVGLTFVQGHADASPRALNFSSIPPNETIPPGTIPPGPGLILHGIVNVIHAAPFDADISNTAIDICDIETNAVVGGPLVYGEQTGYEELYLGEYDWFIAPGGSNCGTELFDIPPFQINAESVLTLFIYGGANDFPLTTVLVVSSEGKLINFVPMIQHQP